MQPTSCRGCPEPASLESGKCRDCGFLFLDSPDGRNGERMRVGKRTYGVLSVLGAGVIGAGFVAAIASYAVIGAGFVAFGTGMMLADAMGR